MTITVASATSALSPLTLAGRAAAPAMATWTRLGSRGQSPSATFNPAVTASFPEPAHRWLTHAVAPGTPMARAAIIEMEGQIRIGRWLAFRAVHLHAPPDGYVWAARARLGPLWIGGFDRYDDDAGEMRWRLFGHIPVMTASGADLDRSAAGRVALDAVFVPTSFLGPAVTWQDGPDADSAIAEWTVGEHRLRPELHFGPEGALRSVTMPRWAKPAGHPWGQYPCGGTLDDEVDFGGIRVPTRMRAGYFFGTDRWAEGEFIRAKITNVTFL